MLLYFDNQIKFLEYIPWIMFYKMDRKRINQLNISIKKNGIVLYLEKKLER